MNLVKRTNRDYPVFNSFFNDEFFDMPVFNTQKRREFVPAVNISENDDEFQIEVAAPGFKKNDFKIELEKNLLTISTEVEQKEENTNYSCKEFAFYSFSRSFNLPENKVNVEKIDAKYKDGILYVSLPKREEEKPKPPRMIKIG